MFDDDGIEMVATDNDSVSGGTRMSDLKEPLPSPQQHERDGQLQGEQVPATWYRFPSNRLVAMEGEDEHFFDQVQHVF
jgi:hypothetical protein